MTSAGDLEAGTGAIIAGQLEMSNVDLTSEFTEMIVAQRGFQANSRIITTSDEILQEVVNLKTIGKSLARGGIAASPRCEGEAHD